MSNELAHLTYIFIHFTLKIITDLPLIMIDFEKGSAEEGLHCRSAVGWLGGWSN